LLPIQQSKKEVFEAQPYSVINKALSVAFDMDIEHDQEGRGDSQFEPFY
jgi:hypothetical protein